MVNVLLVTFILYGTIFLIVKLVFYSGATLGKWNIFMNRKNYIHNMFLRWHWVWVPKSMGSFWKHCNSICWNWFQSTTVLFDFAISLHYISNIFFSSRIKPKYRQRHQREKSPAGGGRRLLLKMCVIFMSFGLIMLCSLVRSGFYNFEEKTFEQLKFTWLKWLVSCL